MPRRLARALALSAAALVVIALAASLALRAYAESRLARARASFEAEVGGLDPARHTPEPVEPEASAGYWIVEGTKVLALRDEDVARIAQRAGALGTPWQPEEEAWFATLLADRERALATMRAPPRSSARASGSRGIRSRG